MATTVLDRHPNIHRKILPLLTPSTKQNRRQNSVLYGGRGGLKTYGAADCAIIRASQQYERVLCARETMDSIAESVHFTLEKRIYDLGLEHLFKIMQYKIEGPEFPGYGHSEFFFAGLHHNIRNIKSIDAVTICWVEEAANVSRDSWEVLLPTVRWEDSPEHNTGREAEIWVTFNPELETDDTYQRWVLNPPPYTYVAKTSYLDNPWLPEGLRIQMEHAKATDPAAYAHVWLGECQSSLSGAIFEAEINKADQEGRLGSVPIDRTKPVDTFWDLGYGDDTAIWFAQPYGGWYNLVDFTQGHGRTVHSYLAELQQRGYLYGTDWLPHDGVDSIIHHKLAGGDRSRSIEMLMRAAGRNVRVCPKVEIADRINAGRTIFSQCRFDAEKCRDGIKALRSYQWGPPIKVGKELVQRTKPLHNWASHASDAFQTLAIGLREAERPVYQPRKPSPRLSPWS